LISANLSIHLRLFFLFFNHILPNYSEAERKVINLISNSEYFMFKNEKYQSVICDKPTSGGEPKTDIFCQATNSRNNIRKFKISFKLDDAAFPQNKITAKIARQLGITQEIINAAINLREEFVDPSKPQKRGLLHFERPSCGRGQEKNSRKITMGWKCEANTASRDLSI
jgi:hypothetical protein